MRKRFAVIPDLSLPRIYSGVPRSVGTRVGKIDPGIIAGATMLESVILRNKGSSEVIGKQWLVISG